MRVIIFLALCLLGMGLDARRTSSRKLQKNGGEGGPTRAVGSCDSNLLRSFNLYGRSVARPSALDICPNVYHSCCTLADQVAIYDNWMVDNEEASLEGRFANFTKTIDTFFKQAEEGTTQAASLLDFMGKVKNNECKLMARRIVSYQIGDLKKALLATFEEANDYFVQTHKGIYCSLCNADSHVYFNTQAKVLQVSEEFCRSLVSNSLTSLMYLRIHLPKYVNLLTTFMGSCNEKGQFKKRIIPMGVVQPVDVTNEKLLTSCFKGRNTATWLTSCQSICQKWTPGKISPFFTPDMPQMSAAINYIVDVLSKSAEVTPTTQRVLSEKPNKSTKRIRMNRKLQQTSSPNTNINTGIDLGSSSNKNEKDTTNMTIVRFEAALDEYGNPKDYLNFTNNGTNTSALSYLISKEMKAGKSRSGLPLNLTSSVVYLSQNTTNVTSFSEWTVVVNTKGANFFESAQYSRINLEMIEGLYDPGIQGTAALPPKTRKLKQKKARKLANATILTSLLVTVLAFVNL